MGLTMTFYSFQFAALLMLISAVGFGWWLATVYRGRSVWLPVQYAGVAVAFCAVFWVAFKVGQFVTP